ncbi:hypothetical protein HXX25_06515 [Hyphobacterium sp. CCMP332]|nr:hypothetical protein HXX25_06515 [Hyphobacterium sp. CCMP332]
MGEDSEALDVTATLLAGDGDPDTGENVLLTISGIETTGTLGQVIFNVGNVTYSPNGAFESSAGAKWQRHVQLYDCRSRRADLNGDGHGDD